MKKNLFYLTLLLVISLIVYSCDVNQQLKNQLQDELTELNKECPVQVEEGIILSNVVIRNDILVCNFTYDDSFFTIEDLRGNIEVLKYEVIQEWKSSMDMIELSKLLVKLKMSIALNFTGLQSGGSCATHISTNELKYLSE